MIASVIGYPEGNKLDKHAAHSVSNVTWTHALTCYSSFSQMDHTGAVGIALNFERSS